MAGGQAGPVDRLPSVSVTIIQTERLILRPWQEDDGPELERLFSDPAVRGERAITAERIAGFAKNSLAQWGKNGFGPWAVIDRATGEWIGRAGLDDLGDWPGPDKIEVGFELHQKWWGRGIATETAHAALRFGFEQHHLERIISVTAATHLAARRVMEKVGLTYQGTLHWKSPVIAVVWYAIDRPTWKALPS